RSGQGTAGDAQQRALHQTTAGQVDGLGSDFVFAADARRRELDQHTTYLTQRAHDAPASETGTGLTRRRRAPGDDAAAARTAPDRKRRRPGKSAAAPAADHGRPRRTPAPQRGWPRTARAPSDPGP